VMDESDSFKIKGRILDFETGKLAVLQSRF
jgi:hypothetical protein